MSGGTIQQQVPQALPEIGAARLTGDQHRQAARLQRLARELDLRAFARSLDALEHHEEPLRRRLLELGDQ